MNPAPSGSGRPDGISAAHAQNVDNETIINLLKLAHARSQKLVETWVPYTKEELEARKDGQSTQASQTADEKLLFRSEYAGLGADVSLPSTTDAKGPVISTSTGSELEKLKKQLLGRKATAKSAQTNSSNTRVSAGRDQKRHAIHTSSATHEESDEDDQPGRSSFFQSKRLGPGLQIRDAETPPRPQRDLSPKGSRSSSDEAEDAKRKDSSPLEQMKQNSSFKSAGPRHKASGPHNPTIVPVKRSQSFLDEMIAAKTTKKKKRRKKGKDSKRDEHGTTSG